MEIKYICTYWGQDRVSVEDFVAKAIKEGYDGVELNIPDDDRFIASLQNSVVKNDAVFIAQQYLSPAQETVDEYLSRMLEYLDRLGRLEPEFINSHTGKDYYSFEDNCRLIEACQKVSESSGVPILHETHRGRFAFHAQSLIAYMEKYPDLRLNADFSHFCTVSESLLEDQEHILDSIIERSSYIHARVGSAQSAQVSYPFAPEWESTLQRFLLWWKQILAGAKDRGEEVFYVCPEFGPAPYMPSLPYTQMPIANQWEINVEMMHFLKQCLS